MNTLDLTDEEEDKPLDPVPPAPPVVVDDEEANAELKEREEAFAANPMWKNEELSWSITKESIFYQLRAANGAPPIEVSLEDGNAFLADAIRILFLSIHEPEDFSSLRSKPTLFQERIENWAEGEILTPQDELNLSSVALKILTLSQRNQPESVPPAGVDEGELGN